MAEPRTSTEVKPKKGTATANVELVVGGGAKALQKVSDILKKQVENIADVVKIADDITNQVATKKAELDGLETQFEEKKRQGLLDVELQIKEGKSAAVNAFLSQLNQTAIPTEELDAIKSENAELKSNFSTALATAKAEIERQEAAKYASAKAIAMAENYANNAAQKAQLDTANTQVAFYKGEVDALRAQLNAERDARVKEAQARGVAAVTVNTSGK